MDLEGILKELELPDGKRCERLSRMLGAAYIGLMAAFAEVIGWERVNEIIKDIVRRGGPGAVSEAMEKCRINGEDARTAFAVYAYSALNMTPGWEIRVAEYTKERVRMYCSGPCVLYSASKEAGLEKRVEVYEICQASHSSIVRAVNPELDYVVTQAMCSGDDVCEFIIGHKQG